MDYILNSLKEPLKQSKSFLAWSAGFETLLLFHGKVDPIPSWEDPSFSSLAQEWERELDYVKTGTL